MKQNDILYMLSVIVLFYVLYTAVWKEGYNKAYRQLVKKSYKPTRAARGRGKLRGR